MNGFKPNLSNLIIFGVPAFVYNFDPLRMTRQPKESSLGMMTLQLVTRFIQEGFEKS
jgi:hypothetical protein